MTTPTTGKPKLFQPGGPGGPGRPPSAVEARKRQVWLEVFTEEHFRAVLGALREKALAGSERAIELICRYELGDPATWRQEGSQPREHVVSLRFQVEGSPPGPAAPPPAPADPG